MKTTNVKSFKDNTTHELFGAIGYLASLNLIKGNFSEILEPKLLLKYSPNHMRKQTGDYSLYRNNIFDL